MFQYSANLLNGDARKPLNELRYKRAFFEVLEPGCYGYPSAAEQRSPTDTVWIAFDSRTCGAVDHESNGTTGPMSTKTRKLTPITGAQAAGRSPSEA